MSKRLDLTPKIIAAIARSTDGSVDPTSVSVFECSAFNTMPVSKKGTLFHGARATENTLLQMADYLNAGTNFVPLHVLHDQGYELPVGRTFAGEVVDDGNGNKALRTLFYLPNTETELIGKIETGTLEEVSVGLKTQHMNCSECGFDYLGAEATFDNLWGQHCNNDHFIGEEGVHVILSGLDRFLELSLVSLGAAKGAKIVSRVKSLMGEATYNQQLAASGIAPEATTLFLTSTTPKEQSMDLTALVASLTTEKAANLVHAATIAASTVQIEALTASNTSLAAEVVALKASADTKLPEVQAALDAANIELTAAMSYVRSEAERVAVAASAEKPADDATMAQLAETIKLARAKLVETIPVGGVSLQATAGTGVKAAPASNSSFKIK